MILAFVYMQTNELADEAGDWVEWRVEATGPRRLDTSKAGGQELMSILCLSGEFRCKISLLS